MLYVSLRLMIFLCPFLHCKALRTAMYKRYINSIIIIIIIENGTVLIWMDNPLDFIHLFSRQFWRILETDYPSLVWKRPLSFFQSVWKEILNALPELRQSYNRGLGTRISALLRRRFKTGVRSQGAHTICVM